MSQGEYDRAEGICRHVLQYYPQDLGAFQLLGQINLERKESRAARDHFRRVLEIDPENISAHWGMGIAYQHEGKTEQTIAEFEQALEIKPDLSDLRAQLLRLYTETYGAEQAQLRLSRAGLGRLYAKGDMLDKAITEFREVLKQDPQRADVQVSLIEALWQRGDLEQSARVCEEVLQRLPDALKANLILGYAHLVAGRREAAEELWRKAAACDPNNTMARVLFEAAPEKIPGGMIAYGAAALPDFDEAGWQAALAAAAAAAQPPAPVEEPAPPVPTPEPEPVAAEQIPPEPSGISWLDSLATGEGEVTEEEAELVPGVAPFDLADIDLLGEVAEPSFEPPAPEAEPTPAIVEEEPAPTILEEVPAPFSLEEEEPAPAVLEEEPAPLALEEAGVAPFVLEEEEAAVAAAPLPTPGDQEMQPFSLEDLGLSDAEIASLEEAISATKATEAPGEPEVVSAEGPVAEIVPAGLQPFSPDEDLGLGEEVELPGVAPFSLEDALEAPEAAAPVEAEEPVGLADVEPFSLDELVPAGADEEVAPDEEAAPSEVAPFSLEEVTAAVPEGEEMPEMPGIEPFSIDSLGFESMPDDVAVPAGLGGELKPFSLEDLGLEEPPGDFEAVGLDQIPDALGEEIDTELPAFSWQEAASSKEPAFRGQLETPEEEPPATGPSLFEKMKASRQDVEAPVEEEPVEPTPVEEEVLAAEAIEPAPLEEAPALAAEAEPGEGELLEIEPFSVEAFGLEEELALEEEAAPEVAPFSLEEMGLEEPAAAKEEAAPFSLAELGLEEELPAVEEAPVAAPAEDVLRPFSLEELGLTPDEIEALGLEEEEVVAEEAVPVAEEALPPVEEALPLVEEVVPEEEVVTAVVEEAAPEVVPGLSLEELRDQVAAHPGDETMLLALARGCVAQGASDEAFDAYKKLIKSGQAGMEDTLISDITAWIEQEEDRKRLHRLHRLLGDAYMKKGQYQQAINEYAWVLSKQ
jgi:tetratricopeptide (TPR) repeat protein